MDNPAENAQDTTTDDLLLADSPEDDDPLLEEPAPARQGLPPGFRMRHDRHYVDELLGVRVAPAVRPARHAADPPAAQTPQTREASDDAARSLRAALSALAGRLEGIRAHTLTPRRAGHTTAFDLAAQIEIDRTTCLAHAAVAIAGDLQLARRDVTAAQIAERARHACAPLRALGGTRFEISVEEAGLRIAVDPVAVTQAIAGTLHALTDLLDGSRDADDLPVIRIRIHIVEPRPALMVEISPIGVAVSDEAIGALFDAGAACHPAGAEGAMLLSAAAKNARAHGGRADARREAAGVVALLVFPR